ncbi:MAG: 30S ribosomal protein S19e [Candidatus Altiarchaeota archaeon]
MTTIYDVPVRELIDEAARDLKDNVKLERPEWSTYVKTGVNKERMPEDQNWWWTRAASVLRKIYIEGPIGVQKLRVKYGGSKNRGRKPEEFRMASGKIIRTILKEFDDAGFTEKVKGGRVITAKGRSYLDKISAKIEKGEDVGA